MAINLNDNIKINAGKPLDVKYLSSSNLPYTSILDVNTTIPVPERSIGLTVNINNDEYWYATGVTDSDLVLKNSASGSTISSFTNVGVGTGVFSGITSGGVVNLRSITGSGNTDVSLSGSTIVVNTIGTSALNSNILFFNNTGSTYQPYSARTTGVTFYYGDDSPTGTTKLNLNSKLAVSELIISTGNTQTGTREVGDIYWDNTNDTISIQQTDNVTQQVGQEQYVKAKNNSGSLIPNGRVVYISGSDTGRPTIEPARADEIDGSIINQVIGVTTEDISAGDVGFVTISGLVRDLNTSSFSDGDVVYLSTTSFGDLTNIKPDYPNYAVEVGIVIISDVTEGILYVRINNVSIPQNIRGVELANYDPFTASTRSDFISALGVNTIYLPASPIIGQEITITDNEGDAHLANLIIDGNGNYINGNALNPNYQAIINTSWGSMTFVFTGQMWSINNITP